jgi:hypothetical protein
MGGGPTGEVFKAKVYGVAGFERLFAVKRFHAALVQDADVAGALAKVARLYGGLEHPRVAKLQEFGTADGATFAATELVEGVDLARLMEQGKLPAGVAARLIIQAGRAIGYAHGRGLSHLGLCPRNLICGVAGGLKVTDFGFLPARLPKDPVTDQGLAARIPYLAPEQLEGGKTSAATDVFSLGVIAYELWTGEKPFRGATSAEIAEKIRVAAPEMPDMPKPFVKVLKRALTRSPFARFPDTGAMADAVEAALRASPLPGDLRVVGEAVKKAMAATAARAADEGSGAVSFPMPAPPVSSLAPQSELRTTMAGTGRPVKPDLPRVTLQGLSGAAKEPEVRSTLTGVTGEHKMPGAAGAALGQIPTIKKLDQKADRPVSAAETVKVDKPLSAELLGNAGIDLGPAGADENAQPGQFLGGDQGGGNDDETVIRESTDEDVAQRFSAADENTSGEWTVAQDMQVAGTLPPSHAGEALNLAAPGSSGPAQYTVSPDDAPSSIMELDLEPDPDSVVQPMPEAPALPTPPPGPGPFAQSQNVSPVHQVDEGSPRSTARGMTSEMVAPAPVQGHATQRDPASQSFHTDPQAGFPEGHSGVTDPAGQGYPAEFVNQSPETYPPAYGQEPQLTSPAASGYPENLQSQPGFDDNPTVRAPAHPGHMPMPPGPSPEPLPMQGGLPPESAPMQGGLPPASDPLHQMALAPPKQESSRPRWPLYTVLFLAIGTCSFLAYSLIFSPGEESGGASKTATKVNTKDPKTGGTKVDPKTGGATEEPKSGGATEEPKAASMDAGAIESVDAAPAKVPASELVIDSNPAGAKVYLDGSLIGKTPQTLDPSPDKHQLALVAPGYKLYTGAVDGSGIFKIDMVEVSPPDGPAGIKVRCRKKNRYYVFIDGVDVGQLCPTERIGVNKGEHVVEIYDPISDSRRSFNVKVDQTRRSLRVRVD